MNDNFTCPFCGSIFPLIDETYRFETVSFATMNRGYFPLEQTDALKIEMLRCPSCKEIIARTLGVGSKYPDVVTNIYPKSLAKQFPSFIPQQIREDYEEAYAIVNLSPKASATLSRRALQGMIRDFHGIKKSRLVDEIDALEEIVTIPEKTVLDSIRNIGNVGAHTEKDINVILEIKPGEAENLLKVIEFFMNSWYIAKHNVEVLFGKVNNTKQRLNEDKKNLK